MLPLAPPTSAYADSPSASILGPPLLKGTPPSPSRVALARLLTDVIRTPSQYDWEKLHQYIEARLNSLYFRSRQYLASASPYSINDYRTVTAREDLAFTSREAQASNPFLYDYILPIFSGDVLKVASVLATRAPNLKANPYIPGKPLDAALARVGNRGLAYLRSHWDLDAFLNQAVLGLCNSGTQFSYVQWETDRDLYGTSTIPGPPTTEFVPEHPPYYQCFNCGTTATEADHMEFAGRCPSCEAPLGPESLIQSESTVPVPGPPDPAASITAPNGAVSLYLHSILTTDIPFHVLSPDLDDCPFLKNEFETYKWSLIRRYRDSAPELAAKAAETSSATTPASRYAADIRQSLLNPSASNAYHRDPNLWLSTELWLTPAMYEAIPHDASGNLRSQLASSFPDGCRICYVNSAPVAIYPEVLRRHWAACKPSLSEGIYGDPLFSAYRQGVEVLNTSLNMVIEALEHMPGEVMFDKTLLSEEFLQENAPRWGAWIGVKFDGRSLSDHIARLPGSELKEGVTNWMEWFFSKLRETVGITPALFGGATSGEKTAREVEIARNQALQQHLVTWNNLRRWLARTAENGLGLLCSKSGGKLYYRTRITSDPALETIQEVEFATLCKGGFRVWAEESFPMTPGQRSDRMQELLANPAALPLLSLVRDPMISPNIVVQNLPILHETLAIEGMEFPDLYRYELLMEHIQQLLTTPMIPPMVDPRTGQPFGPPQPAIQPDPVLIQPPFAIEVISTWLCKELSKGGGAGGGADTMLNPEGILHVRAYLEAWMFIQQQQLMMQQQAMAAAGAGGGEGGSGEGEGGGDSSGSSGPPPGGGPPPPTEAPPPGSEMIPQPPPLG